MTTKTLTKSIYLQAFLVKLSMLILAALLTLPSSLHSHPYFIAQVNSNSMVW